MDEVEERDDDGMMRVRHVQQGRLIITISLTCFTSSKHLGVFWGRHGALGCWTRCDFSHDVGCKTSNVVQIPSTS